MEISSFSFQNPEDFFYSPNTFSFTSDFDFNFDFQPSNAVKKQKTEQQQDIFQDILNHLFSVEPEQVTSFGPEPTSQSSFQVTSGSRNSSPISNKRPRASSDEFCLMQDGSMSSPSGGGGSASQRRLWVKNRSKAWWEQCDRADFPEEEFKREFKMSKTTFDMICRELEPVVNKKDTMLRLAIPVRQRVAVCLWRLATGAPLREVSRRFGLGISTCHKLVLEVCRAIHDVLKPKYLQWPNSRKTNEIKTGFQLLSGIPNVCGSLYTTHVPIIAPKEKAVAYFNPRHTERNQKNSYSVSVQGVVDSNGVFTDVLIGQPGSMTDEMVLEKSSLFQRAGMGLMKDKKLVGNTGYPLMDWILVPYNRPNLTWAQHGFNERVEEVQKVAKEAFMRLKARWSCLQKRTEMKLQEFPLVVMACCVLHNVCELKSEELSPELRFDLFDDQMVAENGVRSVTAQQYRDKIAHKLLHHTH